MHTALSKASVEHMDRLVAWFIPHQAALDERTLSASRMFVYICLINAVFSLLYVFTSLAIGFAMGAAGTPEGDYVGMVSANVNTIVKALK